ncbi:MAG: ABC transporter ATP-binding protein, partial [Clostridia bacterium]|nr:ABC transporter ATP-binding protein [Clostridia bacterium]
MKNVIEINGLYKSFGAVRAVDGLSFRVKEGELFAFLGVNGAGKSTTISILSGQLKRDSGDVSVFGCDPARDKAAIARRIGVVFQSSALDQMLTVRDNLRSRAALYGMFGAAFEKRLAELSSLLSFTDLLDRTVGKLSGG